MKHLAYWRQTLCLTAVLFAGCSGNSSNTTTPVSNSGPNVGTEASEIFRNATYNIDVQTDVVYGQGQSHVGWNAPNPITTDLLLDVYTPMNNQTARPAMVFIHGGGFIGGDKATEPPVAFARYFAERGFVSVSINYRLLGDYGTLPDAYVGAIDALPLLSDADKDQLKAMYPATRDAKAALRWLVANAEAYGVDPDMISVVGGSAGSYIAIALGASAFDDYVGELSTTVDPTLASTNLDRDVIVGAVVDHWGGPATVDLLETVDGVTRWAIDDAPISIIHGTEDLTVPYDRAEALVDIYSQTGAYFELTTLQGAGHSAWNVNVDGQPLTALGFDFVARMLAIEVQP
ncbi:MAG: alpha/beta hydrolase [Pseudomonadota bacterium]